MSIAAAVRQRLVYKPSRRVSGAARFFYKPSRRDSGAVAFFNKPSRRGSFFFLTSRRGSGNFSAAMDISVGHGTNDEQFRKYQWKLIIM
jgi:hypothetical protein